MYAATLEGSMMDVIALHDGRVMQVHPPENCAGKPCSIHNPSDHPLNTQPLNLRADRRIMERMCPHGIGHPDPDDIVIRRDPMVQGIHGCDGCCRPRGHS